ncbi:hypothetical protein LMH87_006554 [Akanthomyces muscarius]|uniref:Uncharacterized protein n=1 Tax=Akanthomyces muscarius TaxID=2231603 RepID=A0A9W8QQH6_AKAMU|nr:hypothetical protein LMH87_006554 [Akanthomyces muscarius]KAJ4164901.1 hypothetical protein LMH87_006554 [Akanthomyces muscarius]
MSSQVWLITGASNGFGLLLALKALAAQHRVIGTVRSKTKSADAVRQITSAGGQVIELDMTCPQAAIIAAVRDAEKLHGQIDILVNNAGYSILGAIEQFSEEEVKLQYQTNVYGPLFTTQGVLPGMRARGGGFIVNMSSGAGQDAGATRGLYGASKFALEGFSEALSAEVAEFGIAVLVVEPGMFRTNFFHALQTPDAPLPAAYGPGSAVGMTMGMFEALTGTQRGDPQRAVDRIYEVVTGTGLAGRLRGEVLRLPLGMDAVERIEAKQKRVLGEVAEAKKLEEQQSTAFPAEKD